ncbi:hypothetical protein C723_2626 [Christiangramia flava JLT2011]|uniref:Uncharacterized protein n=1 Tax=Christiangramia flava JLT2011 TaxID=1229726 RepID=A0A1L7I0Z1_9FLAO|nr:hypothetical protein GRFL_0028 [Christiangramia flava JLT2011]OSS38389.1 hypothetical protein C723_2626 [Christiangramia flava JLT2011]
MKLFRQSRENLCFLEVNFAGSIRTVNAVKIESMQPFL